MRLHWSLLRGPETETEDYNPELPEESPEGTDLTEGEAVSASEENPGSEGECAPPAAKEPESQVSTAGRVLRDLISHVTNDMAIGKKVKNGELRRNLQEPAWAVPECFNMTRFDMDGFAMSLLSSRVNPRMDYVILQLHGGGYIGAVRNAYYVFAGLYNEVSRGLSVLTPDYRVAPEHPFPAALEDAVASFDWLIKAGWHPDQIILAGDSAGGGLALALTMYLRDHGRELPCGIITMSPWTDLTASGESYETNYAADPLFGNTRESMLYLDDYPAGQDRTNPYMSPLFGDFHDFPPILIQVGSTEMLLSDSTEVARKAREADVKVRLHVYEGMFHDFQMAYLMLPESKAAWEEIGKFIGILTKK